MYETHITVLCGTSAEAERLGRWATAAGLKLTHIVLARGRMPAQPMLTLTGSPSYADESARAREVSARLRADGFEPVRVKIESSPWAAEVPREPCADERYFEHHVKLRLPVDADLDALAVRVVPYGAHLSWNARRVARGGRWTERFVTQRCRGVDAAGAGRALEQLLTELRGHEAAGAEAGGAEAVRVEVIDVEREFVLYDSDLSVDDGWIEESGGAVVAASEVRG
ncbi:hypothetical protein [Streptomyces sp. NBC_00576]|uniref:hypothetical protein n=1 Tax=Streptomyces sp. NBC_00576 TaxID=2903665 RepID=UPI002E80783D|nr:hypothetical protein [Streptomyces sp. NBC_00576]WUB74593.1 hypothetical protein OG734_33555 [Streptomyces sp. NBC_00576]